LGAYVGEGQIETPPAGSFGGYGTVHIPNLQRLLKTICRSGFEHHVAMTYGKCAAVLHEALGTYLHVSMQNV
jgi:L-fucose isomerase-like protein